VATIESDPGSKVTTSAKKAKVTFTFDADQNPATFTCQLDGGSFHACTSPKSYKVAPGKHTFAVKATNQYGKTGAPDSFAFKVVKK
jgi:hypothetical protein